MPLNEADTRAQYIDPALVAAGWGVQEGSRVRREFAITAGRILGKNRRDTPLFADYVLEYKGALLAAIEAKPYDAHPTEGLAQAKEYAERLGLRFAYATNGQQIYHIDMHTGHEGYIDAYPTPDTLWQSVFEKDEPWRDAFAAEPLQNKPGQWAVRYYQHVAVTKAMQAIAAHAHRVLLTLATGTGKTTIAFQIAWKLYQTRWTLSKLGNRRPRVLFLADRNILANQAYNDFASFMAFPEDALVRIRPEEITKKGYVPKNGNIFFTIFQTFMSGYDAEGNPKPTFGAYSPDFFDCIIVDECHRGGAKDESTWRGILEYFAPALQIGLTATPKRVVNADTYAYFGEPVYTYSLKDGINDGFLTPFKVRGISTSIDEYTYEEEDTVLEGEVDTGQQFTEKDFNVTVEVRQREAYRVRLFLEEMQPMDKTLVFCANQRHALVIRDIINEQKSVPDPHYCERVTADDGKRGESSLEEFQENDKTMPVILTTSHKLSTGVDALNIRNIVLLRPIKNMIEFKQIIGRGTRLFEGKDYFTIYDFVEASTRFTDKDWDGDPEPPEAPDTHTPPKPPKDSGDDDTGGDDGDDNTPRTLVRIQLADGKERLLRNMKASSFWGPDGKPVSAARFLEALYGKLPELFSNEDELRELWSVPDTRQQLLEGLRERGFPLDALQDLQKAIEAQDCDLYDVLGYVAFATPPALRRQRAENAKRHFPPEYTHAQQEFLQFVLDQYIKLDFTELDTAKLPPLLRVKYGDSLHDAQTALGDVTAVRGLFVQMQQWVYG